MRKKRNREVPEGGLKPTGTSGSASGRTGSLRTRSSHTTVRTVPYTAVQNESDGGPLVGLKKTEEAEFVEMAV